MSAKKEDLIQRFIQSKKYSKNSMRRNEVLKLNIKKLVVDLVVEDGKHREYFSFFTDLKKSEFQTFILNTILIGSVAYKSNFEYTVIIPDNYYDDFSELLTSKDVRANHIKASDIK